MIEVIFGYIEQYTDAATMFAILLLCLFLIAFWKIAVVSTKFSSFEKISDKIDMKLGNIETFMSEIKGNVSHLTTRVSDLESIRFAKKQSPMSLTPEGEKLLAKTMKGIIDDSWDLIKAHLSELDAMNNPYDVEQFLRSKGAEIYERYTSIGQKDHIKRELYLEGATLSNLETMIWVYMRDKYIQENKDLLVEEVPETQSDPIVQVKS